MTSAQMHLEIVIVDQAFHDRTVDSKFLIELLRGPEAKVHFVEPNVPKLLELFPSQSQSRAATN